MSLISQMLTAAAIGAFAAHPAWADNITEPRGMFGAGNSVSCGTWTKIRGSNQARPAEQWVAGYLSGVNMTSDKRDILGDTDGDGVMAWLDNYCQAHPLDKIIKATGSLVKYLRAAKDQH
jgi:hypothetical protein